MGIDPLYFHNWTVVFPLLVIFLCFLVSCSWSYLRLSVCYVPSFFHLFTIDTSYLYSLISFGFCGSIPG